MWFVVGGLLATCVPLLALASPSNFKVLVVYKFCALSDHPASLATVFMGTVTACVCGDLARARRFPCFISVSTQGNIMAWAAGVGFGLFGELFRGIVIQSGMRGFRTGLPVFAIATAAVLIAAIVNNRHNRTRPFIICSITITFLFMYTGVAFVFQVRLLTMIAVPALCLAGQATNIVCCPRLLRELAWVSWVCPRSRTPPR